MFVLYKNIYTCESIKKSIFYEYLSQISKKLIKKQLRCAIYINIEHIPTFQNMKQPIKISFEKFYEIDPQYINLSNPDLNAKCAITPIASNISSENLMELHYKNMLQHKIVDYQYEGLGKICDEMYKNSDYTRVTKKEMQLLKTLNYSNHNTIKNIVILTYCHSLKIIKRTFR